MYIQEVINQGAKYIRRQVWLSSDFIKVSENLANMNLDYENIMANDWEEYIMPPVDPVLNELKDWIYNDLNFRKERQSKYYPYENVNDYQSLFNIIYNNYSIIDKNGLKNILLFIKDNPDKFNF